MGSVLIGLALLGVTDQATKGGLVPLIEGKITGPDGTAIRNARVVAVRAVDGWRGSQDTTRVLTTTDDTGRFRLPTPFDRTARLRVSADGMAPTVIPDVRPGKALHIVLKKAAWLEGTVIDAITRRAIPGARVEARERASEAWGPEASSRHASTDTRGRFRIDGLARAVHTLVTTARGYGRVEKPAVPGAGSLTLVLAPGLGAAVYGAVTDLKGTDLGGVSLQLEREVAGSSDSHAVTDSSGEYRIDGVKPGPYTLVATREGLAPGVVSGLFVQGRTDLRQDLLLGPGASVRGRLVDPEGKPRRGVVRLSELNRAPAPRCLGPALEATTSDDGLFHLNNVPPGAHVLRADVAALGSIRTELEVGGRAVDLGDLVIETGLAIRGTVTDRTGQPVPGAEIVALPTELGTGRAASRSDLEGRFVLGRLQPFTYRLVVTAPGYGRAIQTAQAGTDVQVSLDSGASITGQVVDSSGRPVTDYEIGVEPVAANVSSRIGTPPDAIVDEQGRFLVGELAPGTYSVSVVASGRAPATVARVKLTAGSTKDIGTVRLDEGGVLRGVVVDTRGAPVSGASVLVRRGTLGSIHVGTRVVTDGRGSFEVTGIAPGPAEVVASHPDYAPGTIEAVEIDPPLGPTDIRIVLEQGGRIEGRVLRRDGSGVDGVLLQAMCGSSPAFPDPDQMVLTASDGWFSFEHVPPGVCDVLLVERSGRAYRSTQSRTVRVREGEVAFVDFAFGPILVWGRVTRDGEATPGMRVLARSEAVAPGLSAGEPDLPPEGPQAGWALTSVDGRYSLLLDVGGPAVFTVTNPSGTATCLTRTFEIPDLEQVNIDLQLERALLSGVVVDEATNEPIVSAAVSLLSREQGGQRGEAVTVTGGRFDLSARPGDYELLVSAEGYAPAKLAVSVGQGPADTLRIPLSKGWRIRGRIVDRLGNGLAGVWARVRNAHAGAEGFRDTFSGGDGAFGVGGLERGLYHIVVGNTSVGYAVLSDVPAGGPPATLTVLPCARLDVSVLDENGAPADGALITASSVNGIPLDSAGFSTDASGAASLTVPAGSLRLKVTKGDLAGEATIDAVPGQGLPVVVNIRRY